MEAVFAVVAFLAEATFLTVFSLICLPVIESLRMSLPLIFDAA